MNVRKHQAGLAAPLSPFLLRVSMEVHILSLLQGYRNVFLWGGQQFWGCLRLWLFCSLTCTHPEKVRIKSLIPGLCMHRSLLTNIQVPFQQWWNWYFCLLPAWNFYFSPTFFKDSGRKEKKKKGLLFIVPIQMPIKNKALLLFLWLFIFWSYSPHNTCLILSPLLVPWILAACETIIMVFRV